MPQRRSHLHKVKRLNHTFQYGEQMIINKLPGNIIKENFLNKTSQYTKFFDYPLSELLVDHSTNPLENTTRQYIDTLTNISNEGRFINHEMIIRRNGETTILRPKQDLVLANGFTPVIRPSSILPSYQSIISHHSQLSSSLSIMNKMSIKKSEQTSIIKTKRKNRHRKKRCNKQNIIQNHTFSNEINSNNSPQSTFIHLVKQTLHNIIQEKNNFSSQPVPLMSILPQFHNPSFNNQSQFEETHFNRNTISSSSSYFNQQQFIPSNNQYKESFYDLPLEQNHQINFNFPQHQHICLPSPMFHHRNGYFFD